jgi:hypothetical protein
MRQHLLRVEDGAGAFAELIAAIRRAGGRVGWLELTPPSPSPPALEAAAEAGVLRAVAAGGGRSVAVKPIRGEPVLRDLLREHFRGCVLVLVTGAAAVELPRLTPRGGGWLVEPAGGRPRELGTDELVAALRRPRPWRRERPPAARAAKSLDLRGGAISDRLSSAGRKGPPTEDPDSD